MFLPLLFSLISTLFPNENASLVFAGDAMQHQAQIEAARQSDGTYSYSGCFDSIKPYIENADYAVVNLETPIADSHFSGYPCFNSPKEYVAELAGTGFDLFLTANNHTLDRRDKGLCQTLTNLDQMGLDHIGSYTNSNEREKTIPMVREINGFRVGFLNYTYGTNGISLTTDAIVDYIDRKQITIDINETRKAGAEIICVCIHWGDEYILLPNSNQKSLANFLIEQGADMIIGSHPHVIQPAEIRINPSTGRKVLLVYSLGNFISNMKTKDTRGGMMVRATLTRDANGQALVKDASYRLIFTLPPDKKFANYRLIPVDADSDIKHSAGDRAAQCQAFTNSALRILNIHNRDVSRAK